MAIGAFWKKSISSASRALLFGFDNVIEELKELKINDKNKI